MQTCHPQRGVALVIVLGFLVLLSGLAIAFFSSVTTELGASRTYSNNITTRQLADSSINLVMGQIREATARKGGAWASQPGMIRVYRKDGSASSEADAFFKLYSAKNMIVTNGELGSFDPNTPPADFDSEEIHQDVAKNWGQFPAFFTDLNAPVLVSDPANPGNPPAPVFPIVDPRAKDLVEGFDFNTPAGFSTLRSPLPMPVRWIYLLRDGTLTVPVNQSPTGIVEKWYSASTGKTDFRYPSKDNPIVGRIAFWADDDSSKININTAGGRGKPDDDMKNQGYDEASFAGSFWDTPRFMTKFDMGTTDPTTGKLVGIAPGGLASTQPFQKEFQRYPGHPATTSLGAVFSRLLTSNQIHKLTPTLNYYDPDASLPNNTGGSMQGTRRVEKVKAVALQPRQERLYASLDELLYSARPLSGGKRELNDDFIKANGVVTPDTLEKTKFFLTPHSRSPDLNLFGLPRVAIWPVNQAGDEAEGRSGFDRAIAFCSTIGGQKFIFTRAANNGSGAASSTVDISANLQKGGRYVSWNVGLMRYLHDLTDAKIPGYGGRFVDKYKAPNRDAILGQIFDYIRIANLRDTTKQMDAYWYSPSGLVAPSRKDLFGTGNVGGFGRCSTISEATLVLYCTGVSTDGGKTFVQTELPEEQRKSISHRAVSAFLVFSTFNPMQGYAPITAPWRKPGNNTAYFMPKPSDPKAVDPDKTYGPSGTSQRLIDQEKMSFEVDFVDDFKFDSQSLGLSGTLTNKVNLTSGQTWSGRNFGGYEGLFHTLQTHGKTKSDPYPFHSSSGNLVKVPIDPLQTNQTALFQGGKIKVKIKFGTTTLQTIELNFPSTSLPIPARWYRKSLGGFVLGNQTTPKGGYTIAVASANVKSAQSLLDLEDDTIPGRITWASSHSGGPDEGSKNYANDRLRQIIQPGDVVRSVVYGTINGTTSQASGDLRLLALSENVTADKNDPNFFSPHPDYFKSNLRFAQSLRFADGGLYLNANTAYYDIDAPVRVDNLTLPETTTFGRHLPGIAMSTNKAMPLPASQDLKQLVNGIRRKDANRTGDFDTGMGSFPDGPYSGKPDEGNVIYKYFDKVKQEWVYPVPYKGTYEYEEPGDIFFSPNRQMPSPGLFGSLLARPKDGRPWETLAFCPNTVGWEHPGNKESPKDHLLLDLFTMPFVEPYLISEPLSTAGRVNLNYQIAPFGYIKRSTGLRAALHPLRVTAVSTDAAKNGAYKGGGSNVLLNNVNFRYPINRDQTLAAFDKFYDEYKNDRNGGFFKSASEICERFLYPEGVSFNDSLYDPVKNPTGESSVREFWDNNKGSGDNVREKPYTDLYPRITTKSNTYTVHMRVQTIRQVGVGGDFSKWQEGRDVVVGEYRGASTIERYIDPSDSKVTERITALVKAVNEKKFSKPEDLSLEDLYRFRVIDTKKFAP